MASLALPWKRLAALACLCGLFGAAASLAAGPAPTSTAAKAFVPSIYWRERVSLFDVANRPAAVVMLGDSLTDRAEWRELLPAHDVVNRGIEADTTEGLLARLPQVQALRPRAVFLMIGINDLTSGHAVAEIVPRYRTIVNTLREGGAEVFIESVLPCSEEVTPLPDCVAQNRKVSQLNAQLATLARQTSARYVDIASRMTGQRGLRRAYTLDGQHLTGAGYVVWRDVVAPLMPASPGQ